jgi:Tfp pilus assembly protein PilO
MAVVTYKDTMNRILKSPMRKTFTFLGISLMVIAIFLLGAVKPTLSTIRRLQSEVRVRENIDEELQTKLSNIQTLQHEYDASKDELEVIDLYFPSNTDYSLVLASLEKVTERYGFTLDRMNVNNTTSKSSVARHYPGLVPVQMSLYVKGRSEDITSLVKHLEGLPIVPNIQSVSFSGETEAGSTDGGDVRVTIVMQVYQTTITDPILSSTSTP